MLRLVSTLIVGLVAVGCGGSSPTGPSLPDLSGSWSGTFRAVSASPGMPAIHQPASAALSQNGSMVSGSVTAGGSAGQLSGSVDTLGQFSGNLRAAYGGCQATAALSGRASGSSLALSSVGFTGCPGALPLAIRLDLAR